MTFETRHVGVLYGAFAVALGYGMLVPLVPIFLRAGAQSGDVALHTGSLAATFMAAASFAAPFWGNLSDRIGRREVIFIGLVGASLATVPFMLSQGLAELYLFQGLAGAFFAAVAPAAAALVFENGDLSGTGRRLALLGAVTLAGYLAGPALGGWLAGMSETMRSPLSAQDVVRAAMAMHASVIALAVLLVWWFARRQDAPASGGPLEAHGVGNSLRGTVLVLSAVMLAAFAVGGFEIATSLHVRESLGLGSHAVAAVFVVCALSMLAAQLGFLPHLALRPDRMAWAFGFLIGVAGLLVMMPLATFQGATLGVAAFIGAGLGLAIALLGVQTAALSGRRRGFALGLQSSVANAGQALGSISAGALFGSLGHGALLVLALAIMPPTLILIKMHRRVARTCVNRTQSGHASVRG